MVLCQSNRRLKCESKDPSPCLRVRHKQSFATAQDDADSKDTWWLDEHTKEMLERDMAQPTGPDSALMFTVRDGEPLRLTKEQVRAGPPEACLPSQSHEVQWAHSHTWHRKFRLNVSASDVNVRCFTCDVVARY